MTIEDKQKASRASSDFVWKYVGNAGQVQFCLLVFYGFLCLNFPSRNRQQFFFSVGCDKMKPPETW